MTADRWHKVTQVFHAALARDTSSRDAFIADACGGDRELQQEVEKLLAAHQAVGTISDAVVLGTIGDVVQIEPGTMLGDYRIDSLVGHEVTEIFHRALAHDPTSREALLAEACRSDAALRDEIEKLLAADAAAAAGGGTSVFAPSRLEPGTMVGTYRVESLIGAGGMGEVYRARDTRLRRDIALKILPLEFTADAWRRDRLEREAQVLAGLKHPNIAAIYGIEDFQSVRALVLELVDGETLAETIARGPLALRRALDVARQVADALQVAHENGIVHRDLKPANIVVTPRGLVKVLDFGLAKTMRVEVDPTRSRSATSIFTSRDGVIVGTPAYMSPEQARGHAVDARTDVWAFGCVVFETLTGRAPFEGDTLPDVLAAVVAREPDWHTLPADTPDSVRDLLRRCLQKLPQQRLNQMSEASSLLGDTLQQRPFPRRAPAASRRRRIAATLAVTTLFTAPLTWRYYQSIQEPLADVASGRTAPASVAPKRNATSVSGEAYRQYLQGTFYLSNQTTERLKQAQTYFEEAIRLDNGYAPAHAALSLVYIGYGTWNSTFPPTVVYGPANAAAQRALDLNPSLPEAHIAIGRIKMLFERDWGAAEGAFTRALELQPRSFEGRTAYANYLTAVGRFDDSIRFGRETVTMYPLFALVHQELAFAYYCAGRDAEALDEYGKALEFDSSLFQSHVHQADIHIKKGLVDRANPHVEAVRSLMGSDRPPYRVGVLGYLYAKVGRPHEAAGLLAELESRSMTEHVPASAAGTIYAGLGRHDEAIAAFERGFAQREVWLTWLKAFRIFEDLRPHPGFKALIERMKFPAL